MSYEEEDTAVGSLSLRMLWPPLTLIFEFKRTSDHRQYYREGGESRARALWERVFPSDY